MEKETKEGVLEYLKERVLENLANIVTFFRLFGTIWILVIATCNPEQLWRMTTIAAFVVLTDFLDGKIARKQKIVSPFGAALDQLGDKVFVVPTIIILAWRYRGVVAGLPVNLVNFTIALIVLLLFIESLLFVAWWILFIHNKIQIHSNKWAKCKTFSIFPVVIIWLISLILEIEFKISIIQHSIYLITLSLIITDIFGCAALRTYYQEYFKLGVKEKGKEEN